MDTPIDLFYIVDSAVKDISKRVAKLNISNTESVKIEADDTCTLYTTTSGDYHLTIALHTDSRVLRAITENMKRSAAVSEEDIAIYPIEYFNILCGHVVTAMNNIQRTKARFDIPRIIIGPYETIYNTPEQRWEYCYDCPYGPVKLETFYHCA